MFGKQLKQAASLDEIITAHTHFIDAVRRGTLLDEKSQVSAHTLHSNFDTLQSNVRPV